MNRQGAHPNWVFLNIEGKFSLEIACRLPKLDISRFAEQAGHQGLIQAHLSGNHMKNCILLHIDMLLGDNRSILDDLDNSIPLSLCFCIENHLRQVQIVPPDNRIFYQSLAAFADHLIFFCGLAECTVIAMEYSPSKLI